VSQGFAVRIIFRYVKGRRSTHTSGKTSFAQKIWTFYPLRSSRLELDIALLLTAMATGGDKVVQEVGGIEESRHCVGMSS
jgi:hypothetical protein